MKFGNTQFVIFRTIFGLYLTIHFWDLLPYVDELFSNKGMITDAKMLPTYSKFNFLMVYDDSLFVRGFCISLILASIMLTFGIYRNICAIWIFYGWVSMVNRNIFISNPGLAYVGWILLAMILIPTGETFKKNQNWKVPELLYYGAWAVMSISYTVSGLHKLSCPSWIDGSALNHVLSGPLSRNNWITITLTTIMPPLFLQIMTWTSLFAEISFGIIGTFYHTRKYYGIFFIIFHIGILMTIRFTDLTFGVLMMHLFTIDLSWFKLPQIYTANNNFIKRSNKKSGEKSNKKLSKKSSKKLNEKLSKKLSKKINKKKNKKMIEKYDSDNDDKITFIKWISSCVVFFSVIFCFVSYLQYSNLNIDSFLKSFYKITEISLSMWDAFGIVGGALIIMMVIEKIYPDKKLEYVEGWWKWAILINVFQLFAAILGAFTWEEQLQKTSYFTSTTGWHLRDHVSPFIGGVIAYLLSSLIFYWWHLFRHINYFLWVATHQFHHSASRLEIATAFYKHPVEMIIDSQILAILSYSVLGLSVESGRWLTIFCGLAEYFYHMNVKTPQWIGYFLQRPESHRRHHLLNKRIDCPNLSDIPLYDILGGTFDNPKYMNDKTGFDKDNELRRIDMLCFTDVILIQKSVTWKKIIRKTWRFSLHFIIIWGTLNSIGFLVHNDSFKNIGFSSVSSPLPLVFTSYNGIETFATRYEVNANFSNGTIWTKNLNSDMNEQIEGPYKRKNVYTVMLSHGAFFDKSELIELRDQILYYGSCSPGNLVKELGINEKINNFGVKIYVATKNDIRSWNININCLK
jgi:sterol desaturase/sphingolipid hydroxylase (fatty acid hydroxylase superfamily)